MKMKLSGGWTLDDLQDHISFADSVSLSDDNKRPFLGAKATAASKTLTLGLDEGDIVFLINEGENAFTVKNVSGDSGTSVAAGVVALVVASKTANATTVTAIYTPSV